MPFSRMRETLRIASLQYSTPEQFLLNAADYGVVSARPAADAGVTFRGQPAEPWFEGVPVKPSSLGDGKSWLLVRAQKANDLQPIPV
ncbi:hypothetical protein [Phenylobacterium sp.]|uniref:hypothetical protein n=1 Tax=Phenylobacterium sp. TaxID=1871053 RepID=UPI0025F81DA2|nr:hypothetical protein [Phenylobacterium sp.]